MLDRGPAVDEPDPGVADAAFGMAPAAVPPTDRAATSRIAIPRLALDTLVTFIGRGPATDPDGSTVRV